MPENGSVEWGLETSGLAELGDVWWRTPMDERRLRARERVSTAFTVVYVLPFCVIGAGLLLIEPWLFPVSVWSFLHAWVIPELFAHRGARVVFPLGSKGTKHSERRALGLLGDLLDHEPRELMLQTGLALERGRFGAWLVGEAGALLVRPGGWRVHCFCVRATEAELPRADRIAHLLLALREDEVGFATVANHAFAGATWRIYRRLKEPQRPALLAAIDASTAERPEPAAPSAQALSTNA